MGSAHTVTSSDGTTIAFDKAGNGPAVILVASALADRSDAAKLAKFLEPHFTVINYDRRGRGLSADTPPYTVERECEDIEALVKVAGGAAFLFGSSSGAALALEAAARGVGVEKLALFEPPFVVQEGDPRPPEDFARRIQELVEGDRRAEAVTYFMTKGIGMPAATVAMMRLMPRTWANLKAMAHTIPYDIAVMGDTQAGRPLAAGRWASIGVPTLVMSGSKSSVGMRHAAEALALALPQAEHRTIEGVGHSAIMTAPKKLAPVLSEFFATR